MLTVHSEVNSSSLNRRRWAVTGFPDVIGTMTCDDAIKARGHLRVVL